jgi:hypothetical protein
MINAPELTRGALPGPQSEGADFRRSHGKSARKFFPPGNIMQIRSAMRISKFRSVFARRRCLEIYENISSGEAPR